jgi:hypothetical protein
MLTHFLEPRKVICPLNFRDYQQTTHERHRRQRKAFWTSLLIDQIHCGEKSGERTPSCMHRTDFAGRAIHYLLRQRHVAWVIREWIRRIVCSTTSQTKLNGGKASKRGVQLYDVVLSLRQWSLSEGPLVGVLNNFPAPALSFIRIRNLAFLLSQVLRPLFTTA